MAYTSKLCNPTPWDAVIDWDRGIRIRVPAFGEAALNMRQMDDFIPGKAGSEEAQKELDSRGLFLLNSDRPYDNQAAEALERFRAVLQDIYRAADRNLVGQRAAAGVAPNEEALEETRSMMGLVTLRKRIDTLQELMTQYKASLKPESSHVREQFDPTRTVFVLESGPRQFPSVTAMEVFLAQNPEIKAEHEAWVKRTEAVSEGE